ncbi:MAG: S24/S26 family peptidase [Nocardioidaceae bacterium]
MAGAGRAWGMAVVRGRSMLPTLHDGDRLLVRHGGAPGPGRLVVARFPDGRLTVKRAVRRTGSRWWVAADNAEEGVDSRHVGPVPAYDVVAVVRARLWPRPQRL